MPERPPPAASKDKKPLWLRVLIWIGIAYAAVMGLSLVVFIAGENRGFSSLQSNQDISTMLLLSSASLS